MWLLAVAFLAMFLGPNKHYKQVKFQREHKRPPGSGKIVYRLGRSQFPSMGAAKPYALPNPIACAKSTFHMATML